MANTKSTQHEIPLTSELNLNKFKAEIKPYSGFNERNSPYYGGALSPLFCKNENVNDTTQFYNGHKYYVNGGHLYKDGSSILDFDTTGFKKEIIEKTYNGQNVEILNYYNDSNYVYLIRTNSTEHLRVRHGVYDDLVCETNTYINSTFNEIGDRVYFAILTVDKCYYGDTYHQIDPSTDYATRLFDSKSWGILNIDTLYVDKFYVYINTTICSKINKGKYKMYIVQPSENESEWVDSNPSWHYVLGLCGSTLVGYVRNVSDNTHSTVTMPITINTDGSINIPDDLRVSENEHIHNFKTGIVLNENLCIFRDKVDNKGVYDACSVTIPDTSYYQPYFPDYVDPISCYVNQGLDTIDKITGDSKINLYAGNVHNQKFTYVQANNGTDTIGRSYGVDSQFIYVGTTGHPTEDSLNIYSTFSESNNNNIFYCAIGNIVERNDSTQFKLTYSPNGTLLGISYGTKVYEGVSNDGTLLTSWGSVDSNKQTKVFSDKVIFFDTDLNKWCKITTSNSHIPFKIIDKYLVVNTTSYYNCINLETLKKEHWASDWNNIFYDNEFFVSWVLKSSLAGSYKTATVAGGKNVNWIDDNVPSIKAAPVVYYYIDKYPPNWGYTSYESPIGLSLDNLDLYINSKYVYTLREFHYYGDTDQVWYIKILEEVKPQLIDTTYPGDAVRNNLPILFDVIQGPLDTTLVNFGSNVSFFLIYYDNINRYQYYNSSITEFEDFFVIQGQTYGIGRNKIYSLAYANGAIQSSIAIAPLEGLIFIGNTIYNAYFYSSTVRAIYSFGADNNLQMFTQADTITGVSGSTYLVGTGSLIIGTPECTYVLNERFGIYRLPIQNMKYAAQLDGQVVIVYLNETTDLMAEYIAYEPLTNYTKQNIVLDTSFYGAGSNVVSVNDCWYIRVTDTERGEGEIKLAVSTLTDIGRSTETKTFKIKAKDWDELTDTVYIRFQPKLQRAVGVSLHIESPFKVGYIGVGATPETLQLNKGTI